MVTILFAIFSIFAFRFRSHAALELMLVALEHQLAVLRRQRPGRPQLSSLDRLLWVLLYRVCPKVIDAMVLVRPATVVDWHRRGFRFYWRWRSRRPGRPKISPEIRDLIRCMSKANPLWGAAHPRGTAQARHRHQPSHGWTVDAVASQGPLPDLAELSAQSPAGNCGD
jgi:putative transposase